MITTAYKVLTHDLRPPIQGGDPLFDGKLPFTLPRVKMDPSQKKCGAGWNACTNAHTALRIVGLWPNGHPSRLFRVETDSEVLQRGDKLRAEEWTLVEEVCDFTPVIRELSKPLTPFIEEMTVEQLAWRAALARPHCDKTTVEKDLQVALDARGLTWKLRRFTHTWDAWDAWAAQDAWGAQAAWAAWAAWAAQDAWDVRAAWGARAAWAAWDALITFFAAKNDWITTHADLLTVGIRDAYLNGLAIAIPTGPNELGWVMKDK